MAHAQRELSHVFARRLRCLAFFIASSGTSWAQLNRTQERSRCQNGVCAAKRRLQVNDIEYDEVIIDTFVGIGSRGTSAQGVPYLETFMGQPSSVFYQNQGMLPSADGKIDQLYMIDSENNDWRSFVVSDDTSFADTGNGNFLLNQGTYGMPVQLGEFETQLRSLDKLSTIIAFWVSGTMYSVVPDRESGSIYQWMNLSQEISVLVNRNRQRGLAGDCGPATLASTRYPTGVVAYTDSRGVTMSSFVDSGNNRVRAFEYTQWPSCVQPAQECDQTTYLFNYTTGEPCTDCSIMDTTPDWCAFTCFYYGTTRYPGKRPAYNKKFTSAQQAQFLTEAYLDTTVRRPPYAKIYVVKQDFLAADGSVYVETGMYLVGVVVQGTVRRLSLEEATSGGHPQSLFGPSAVLRFEATSFSCAAWSWHESGACYLRTNGPACSGSDSAEINGTSGDKDCRPGMIITEIGSGTPGGTTDELESSSNSMTPFQTYNPLEIKLGAPTGIIVYSRFLGAADLYSSSTYKSLLVADTLHSRVLRKVLFPTSHHRVVFSLFFTGKYYAALNDILTNEYKIHAIGYAITDYLLYQVTPDNYAKFHLLADVPALMSPVKAAACDPEGVESSQIPLHDADLNQNLCRDAYCSSSTFGFGDAACCIQGCSLCLQQCSSEFYSIEGASTSADVCTAWEAYRKCVLAAQQCTQISAYEAELGNCTVDASQDDAFFDRMSGFDIRLNRRYTTAGEYCRNINNQTAFGLCEGTYCDLDWFKILGVDPVYMGKPADSVYEPDAYRAGSLHIVGLTFAAVFYSPKSFLEVMERLRKLKMQELALKQAKGEYDWDYLSSTEGKTTYPQLYEFHHRIFNYIDTLYSLSDHDCGGQACTKNTLGFSISMSNNVGFDDTEMLNFGWSREEAEKSVSSIVDSRWLTSPYGMIADRAGRLLVCDRGQNKILMLSRPWDAHGFKRYVAGTGWGGYGRDNIPAERADLNHPTDVSIDNKGIVYVADSTNHRIRRLTGLSSRQIVCNASTTYLARISEPTETDLVEWNTNVTCYYNGLKTSLLLTIRNCLWCRDSDAKCDSTMSILCSDGSTPPSAEIEDELATPPNCDNCDNYTTGGCEMTEAGMDIARDPNSTCVYNTSIGGDSQWSSIACQTAILSQVASDLYATSLTRTFLLVNNTGDWLRDGTLDVMTMQGTTSTAGAMEAAKQMAEVFDGETLKARANQMRDVACLSDDILSVRFLLMYWYLELGQICAPSLAQDENALVGALYYTPKNLIPQLYLMPLLLLTGTSLSMSTCHARCFLGQPLHIWPDVLPAGTPYRCCGTMGYLCGVGEGACKFDTDCAEGLYCAENACPSGMTSSSLSNCCMDMALKGTLRSYRHRSLNHQADLPELQYLQDATI